MQRRIRFFVLFFAVFAILGAGCVTQSFHQKVNPDGSSAIRYTSDFSKLTGYFSYLGAESEEKLAENLTLSLRQACDRLNSKDRSTPCTSEGMVLMLERNFTAKDGYYSFEARDGVPYKTYVLTVYKLPTDKFGKAMQQADIGGNAEIISASAIDLRKKDEAAVSAQGLEQYKLDFYYEVEMPGEVTSAKAGNYSAEILNSTARFDMVRVMGDSAPLVVESRELNVFLMVVVAGVVLLALLAVLFFYGRRR